MLLILPLTCDTHNNSVHRPSAPRRQVYCAGRPMRISVATPKRVPGGQQAEAQGAASAADVGGVGGGGGDATNTTVFVGGLDASVCEQQLRQVFSAWELLAVKIPPGKNCGFVQFARREDAEAAIERLHGAVVGQLPVRLSWGRSPTIKPPLLVRGIERGRSCWLTFHDKGALGMIGICPLISSNLLLSSSGARLQEQAMSTSYPPRLRGRCRGLLLAPQTSTRPRAWPPLRLPCLRRTIITRCRACTGSPPRVSAWGRVVVVLDLFC